MSGHPPAEYFGFVAFALSITTREKRVTALRLSQRRISQRMAAA